MPDVRALVLRSAGTNCDVETVRALELAGAATDRLHLNALSADPARLADYAVLAIAGGFSYGDYVAAGRVFGLELRHRLDGPLHDFVARGGLVVGICNGFQVLVELGMLQDPGLAPSERTIALTDNASNRFECRWVTLLAGACACPWIDAATILPVPVAHAEGRFVVRDRAALDELTERHQVALTYVDPRAPESAGRDEPVSYPWNPNGSIANIAGICDPTGRVLGLMPHPERNVLPWHHPQWTRLPPRSEGEGLGFFRRMVEVAAGIALTTTP